MRAYGTFKCFKKNHIPHNMRNILNKAMISYHNILEFYKIVFIKELQGEKKVYLKYEKANNNSNSKQSNYSKK